MMNAPQEFLNFFRAGKEAARRGDNTQAHILFRQAIEVDPYHEQVWMWLATVVETDEDRRVCFENVLQLNPTNLAARRQLQLMNDNKALPGTSKRPQKRRSHRSARRAVLAVILLVLIASAIILAVSLI
jgi:ferric-dicitrate binding protein FerR (iron transport regulator)